MIKKVAMVLLLLTLLIFPATNPKLLYQIKTETKEVRSQTTIAGDIIVESGQTHMISDADMILAGKILVYSGGKLIIKNSVIKFDLTYDGQYYIKVEKGGSIEIIDSTITSNDPRYKFYIVVLQNATLRIEGSTLSNMGYSDNYPGLQIFADNAFIKDTTFLVNYAGIVIQECSNITIINSAFIENWDGMRIDKGSNITIKDSRFSGGQVGIKISGSTNITVANSTFENIASDGIVATGSVDVKLIDNHVESCGFGFFISDTKDVVISNNIVLNSKEQGIYLLRVTNLNVSGNYIAYSGKQGLYIDSTIDAIIEKNNLTRDIIWLYGNNDTYTTTDIKENNLVNGYPVFYLFANQSLTFSNVKHYGQIFLIFTKNITFNRTVIDSLIIVESSDILIYRGSSGGNIDSGISIFYSENIRIIGYKVYDSDTGIGVEHSNYVFITDCEVQNAKIKGIYLFRSNYIEVTSCYLAYNEYGISASFVDNLNITLNTFYHNYCGVGLGLGVTNAFIYMNNFLYNNRQAFDEGSAIWDNGAIGNFWSDYAGPDRNFDAVGDRPYQIDGNSLDRYPSLVPLPKYEHDTRQPSIIRFYLSTEKPQANEKFWVVLEASDDTGIANVILYVSYENKTEYFRMLPYGNVFKAEIGPYPNNTNLTLGAIVYDLAGNSAEITNISVIVEDTTPPIILDVSWSPEKPNVTDAIEISAVVIEQQTELKVVYLYYTIDNGITWIRVQMGTEDGQNYWARIGPFNKPVTLLFYIEAIDSANNAISSHIVTIVIGQPIRLLSAQQENMIILSALAVMAVSIIVALYSFSGLIVEKLKKLKLKRKEEAIE